MKLTLEQLNSMKTTLDKYLEKNFHFRLSFKLMKLSEALTSDWKIFQDSFLKILKEKGQLDEKGNLLQYPDGSYKIKDGELEETQKLLTELKDTETEVTIKSKFRLKEEDLDHINPSAADLMVLEQIIDYSEEEE